MGHMLGRGGLLGFSRWVKPREGEGKPGARCWASAQMGLWASWRERVRMGCRDWALGYCGPGPWGGGLGYSLVCCPLLLFIIIFIYLLRVVFSVFYLCLLHNTSPICLCKAVRLTNILCQSIEVSLGRVCQ